MTTTKLCVKFGHHWPNVGHFHGPKQVQGPLHVDGANDGTLPVQHQDKQSIFYI